MPRLAARFHLPALVLLGLAQEAVLLLLVSRPRSLRMTLACLAATLPFYLIAMGVAWRSPQLPLRLIFGFAVLFRLTLLPVAPGLSNDLYRYRWDGKLQSFNTYSFNPYVVAPDDQVLSPIRGGDGPVNAVNVASFRPPLAESVFHRAFSLSHALWVQKLPWVLCDLLLVLLLIRMLRARNLPAERVLLYAWSPLVIFEIAGNGHLDSGAALLALLAFHWLGRRDRLGAVALVSAILTQWYALVLLPVFFTRAHASRWLLALLMAAWAALVTLPYLFFNHHLSLALIARNLRSFMASNLGTNASWYFGTRHFLSTHAAMTLDLLLWAAALTLLLARRSELPRVALASVGGWFLVAPFVFPWFLLALAPWLVLSLDAGWFVWTLAAPLAYLHGAWQPQMWEYVPVYVLLTCAVISHARRRRAS